MLTHTARETETAFAVLREREFARLDANGIAYLDYAGAALYADSQLEAHRARLADAVFGNPHSAHRASADCTAAIDAARNRVLRFLDAGDDYVVCFTANTTAAIRLVAESYPFSPGVPFVLPRGSRRPAPDSSRIRRSRTSRASITRSAWCAAPSRSATVFCSTPRPTCSRIR